MTVDTWEMPLVHRVFRREFRMLPAIVRAVAPGDTARAEVVGAHLANIAHALEHHHTSEDELLWPILLSRAGMHADLVTRMEAQHARLHEPLARIASLLPRWRSSAAAADRDALAGRIAEASGALDEHLTDEEQEVLPIVATHLTQAEWDVLGERGRDAIPKGRMALVFLGAILEEATPQEQDRFLGTLPLPARLLWRTVGPGTYARARDSVRKG